VDIWALGVLVFIMMCGKFPFYGPTKEEIQASIIRDDPDYSHLSKYGDR
jgi:serine/threonine protein kinase